MKDCTERNDGQDFEPWIAGLIGVYGIWQYGDGVCHCRACGP